jgi:hypothetical protein
MPPHLPIPPHHSLGSTSCFKLTVEFQNHKPITSPTPSRPLHLDSSFSHQTSYASHTLQQPTLHSPLIHLDFSPTKKRATSACIFCHPWKLACGVCPLRSGDQPCMLVCSLMFKLEMVCHASRPKQEPFVLQPHILHETNDITLLSANASADISRTVIVSLHWSSSSSWSSFMVAISPRAGGKSLALNYLLWCRTPMCFGILLFRSNWKTLSSITPLLT